MLLGMLLQIVVQVEIVEFHGCFVSVLLSSKEQERQGILQLHSAFNKTRSQTTHVYRSKLTLICGSVTLY